MGTEEIYFKDILFALRDEYLKIEAILSDLLTHFEYNKPLDEKYLYLVKDKDVVMLCIHLRERQIAIKNLFSKLVIKEGTQKDVAIIRTDSNKVVIAGEYYSVHNCVSFGMKASSLIRSDFAKMFSSTFGLVSDDYGAIFTNRFDGMTMSITQGDIFSSLEYVPSRDSFLFTPGENMNSKDFLLKLLYSPVSIDELSDYFKKLISDSMLEPREVVIENGNYGNGVTEFSVEDFKTAYVLKNKKTL